MDDFAVRLPKAELHLHIEGTLEPELMLALAERNRIAPPYGSIEAARAAYDFQDLQSFLDLYYRATSVLRTEADFADLADRYFQKAAAQGVVHAEIFFDPQAHTRRGIAFETVLEGLWSAAATSEERYGISSGLILCFLRDLGAEAAMQTLDQARPYRERILGVGLDSAERGHPPSAFAGVFREAKNLGWHRVAHAGEEGPPAYVWEALDVLSAERIDHGVRSLEDPRLVERLAHEHIPLTVCPLSNVRLRVVARLEDHPLKEMLDAGLCATCNSDDPAYFGGYVADNLRAASAALDLSPNDLTRLARNSFEAAFVPAAQKSEYLARVDAAAAVAR